MDEYRLLQIEELGDERGALVVLENNKEVPFEIKRIFYIYNTQQDVVRGQHANRYSQFVLISINGSCKVLIDDGNNKKIVVLDEPNKALYLNAMIWKEMYNFSKDAVLLVLASEEYDATEYVRDYTEFIKERRDSNER